MSELRTTMASSIFFAPFVYEHTVPVSAQGWDNIQDVVLYLTASPSPFSASSVSDIHVYVNGNDLTQSVVREIKKRIGQADQGQVQAQYHAALSNWLEMERKLDGAYPADYAQEREVAHRLSQMNPSEWVMKLGDHSTGWGGCFHIINFLYKEVSIPPMSLTSILADHSLTEGVQLDLNSIAPISITFSSGPCRLFMPHAANNWHPIDSRASGTLKYQIEMSYYTPIQDQLNVVAESVSSTGTLSESIANIKKTLQSLYDRVDRCESNIGDSNNIVALNASLKQIKDRFGIV